MQELDNDHLIPDETNDTAPEEIQMDDDSLSTPQSKGEPDSSDQAISIEPDQDTPKEESKARQTFRKFLRWTVGLLVVFGLGFLFAVFTIYNTKVEELNNSQNNLGDAGSKISELESQVSNQQDLINNLNTQIEDLNNNLSAIEEANQELIEKQVGFNLHIALLNARADIVSAQVELYEENSAQAKVLLENTNQTFITIKVLLPDDLKDVVTPLQSRLELAVGEIDDDPETAIADLGILAGDLLEIENALFNK